MTIETAKSEDFPQIQHYDRHIPGERLLQCVEQGQVLVLKDGKHIRGILRWSLFWQTIPFVDLLFLDFTIHGQGFGRKIMAFWEDAMKKSSYSYVMTSTQADETAWQFYEKLGYRKIGSFLPPQQDAPELMYGKELSCSHE